MSVATTMRDHLHHTCNHFRRAEHYCRAPANKRRCLRLVCGSYTRRGVLRPLEYGRPTSVPSAQNPQPANSHGAAVQGDEPSRLCGRVSQRCGRPDLCDGFEKETLTAYGWRNKLEQPLRTLRGRRLSEAPRSVGGSETLGRGTSCMVQFQFIFSMLSWQQAVRWNLPMTEWRLHKFRINVGTRDSETWT